MNLRMFCCLVVFIISISGVSSQRVRTSHGPLQGFHEQVLGRQIDIFYGVPFAKPPVGEQRFKHPLPAEPWGDAVRDATSQAPICVQTPLQSPYEPLRTDSSEISEDCLYLNIWVPAGPERNLATMVWLYGGAYTTGSINRPIYDGRYLAAFGDVIVISINYRVGALGFFYLGTEDFPGNQGMMDQVMALEWINDNIEKFGGNRQKITLFGESAGASSAGYHLLSPLSQNLFTNAILESGSPTAVWASTAPEASTQLALSLSSVAGCPGPDVSSILDCMQSLNASDILTVQSQFDNGLLFAPVIDGHFLPDNPTTLMLNGSLKQTNILLGVQKDEGTVFLRRVLPSIYQLTNELNLTRTEFLTTISTLSAMLGAGSLLSSAIINQYETPEESFVDIADDVVGDCFFKCPAVALATEMAKANGVFMYSLEYIIESSPWPEWMGVFHSSDLEIVFGHPLGDVLTVTPEEIELSKRVMRYWSNFAKSGNPNVPIIPRQRWPRYRQVSKKHLVLDVGRRLEVEQSLREAECVFWEQILNQAV